MALTAKTVAIAAVTILAMAVHSSDAFSTCNITVRREPKGAVELIELTLPQVVNGKISADSKRAASEEEPRFEIFIKSNKNRRDKKGAPKIKVFVDSDEYNTEKQLANGTSSDAHGDYQLLPLTINNSGLNVNRQAGWVHSEGRTSSSGKAQTHPIKSHSNNTSFVYGAERRDSGEHGGSQIKTYRDASTSYKNDGKEHGSRPRPDGSLIMPETIPVQPTKRSSPESTTRRPESEILKATVLQPLQYGNPTFAGAQQHHHHHHHHHHPEPTPQSHSTPCPTDETIPSAGKEPAYETEAALSQTYGNPYNAKPFADNHRSTYGGGGYPERSERRTEYADFEEQTTHRRPVNEDEEERPVDLSTGRKTYRDTGYSSGRTYNNDYSRRGTSYSEDRERDGKRSERRQVSSGRRTQSSDDVDYPYNRPEATSLVDYTERPYEYATRYETTTKRHTTQNSYGGFPDSYTGYGFQATRHTPLDSGGSLLGSTCPDVFEYTKHDTDRWYADIFVSTDVVLIGMRLEVILSKRADLMTASPAERVRSMDNLSFTVLSLKKKLVPGTREVVKIMVKYNADNGRTAPLLSTINLNGRTICSPNSQATQRPYYQSELQDVLTTTRRTYVFPAEVQEPKRTTEKTSDFFTRPPVVYTSSSSFNVQTTTPQQNRPYRTTPAPPEYAPAPNPASYEPTGHGSQSRPNANRPSYVNNKPATDNRRPVSSSNNNFGGDVVSGSRPTKPPPRDQREIPCGLPAIQPRPLVTNGQLSRKGQWPWHVAVYKNILPNLKYTCGGTLVSNRHVITAAHCVTKEYTTEPLEPKSILLYFGKYHLTIYSDHGIVSSSASRVSIHPNYNATDFRSDLAVVRVEKTIDFNDFIRPACLWDKRNTRIEDIVGHEGTVIGWGIDETKELSEELKQAKMPVISNNDCLWSDPDFYPRFTSNVTYCAGFKNGTSVCNGDSGGGMVFPRSVQGEERWYLRGLVSISQGLKGDRICDSYKYVVFTDVAKFLPWIDNQIT